MTTLDEHAEMVAAIRRNLPSRQSTNAEMAAGASWWQPDEKVTDLLAAYQAEREAREKAEQRVKDLERADPLLNMEPTPAEYAEILAWLDDGGWRMERERDGDYLPDAMENRVRYAAAAYRAAEKRAEKAEAALADTMKTCLRLHRQVKLRGQHLTALSAKLHAWNEAMQAAAKASGIPWWEIDPDDTLSTIFPRHLTRLVELMGERSEQSAYGEGYDEGHQEGQEVAEETQRQWEAITAMVADEYDPETGDLEAAVLSTLSGLRERAEEAEKKLEHRESIQHWERGDRDTHAAQVLARVDSGSYSVECECPEMNCLDCDVRILVAGFQRERQDLARTEAALAEERAKREALEAHVDELLLHTCAKGNGEPCGRCLEIARGPSISQQIRTLTAEVSRLTGERDEWQKRHEHEVMSAPPSPPSQDRIDQIARAMRECECERPHPGDTCDCWPCVALDLAAKLLSVEGERDRALNEVRRVHRFDTRHATVEDDGEGSWRCGCDFCFYPPTKPTPEEEPDRE